MDEEPPMLRHIAGLKEALEIVKVHSMISMAVWALLNRISELEDVVRPTRIKGD